jgi:hypothetical protein
MINMKYLIPYNEALSLSDYKKWKGFANKKFYEKMGEIFNNFPNKDKKANRIYFDLPFDPEDWKVKVPQELSDYLGWFGYPIVDYNKGLVRDKSNREVRIGHLLHKLGREDLVKVYNDSKINTLKDVKDLQVVICRHPYDIIGMSTGRKWSTCLNLKDERYGKKHLHHLKNFLENGCLVAYLIRKNDRNLNNPLARILIQNSLYGGGLKKDYHIYGTEVKEFSDFVGKWCAEYNDGKFKVENKKSFKEGDRVIYKKEGSDRNGKKGIFNGTSLVGNYRILFDDGSKFAALPKHVFPDKI